MQIVIAPHDLPTGAIRPAEVLRFIASRIPALSANTLHAEVWEHNILDRLVSCYLNVALAGLGPGFGIVQVEHASDTAYPAYAIAGCFGAVWPPPPLGPNDPSYKIAPSANSPTELVALVNQVFASEHGQMLLAELLSNPESQENASQFADDQQPLAITGS